MPMVATAIRFAPAERDLIQTYAELHGKNFSAVVREAILDKIEDEYDITAYNEAKAKDDGIRIPWEEVKAELGL